MKRKRKITRWVVVSFDRGDIEGARGPWVDGYYSTRTAALMRERELVGRGDLEAFTAKVVNAKPPHLSALLGCP